MDLASIDHVLSTTRSVRLRLDLARPVERETIEKCIEIAIQAPNGGNAARYHFVVVNDPGTRSALADIYRKGLREFAEPGDELDPSPFAVSSRHLAEHLHQVPVHIIPCIQGNVRPEPFRQAILYGSILPATWSLMLALRARGLGASWTTAHLVHEEEAAALLGIPPDVRQVALLPVAYFTGTDFKPAPRPPGNERTHWDTWGRTGA